MWNCGRDLSECCLEHLIANANVATSNSPRFRPGIFQHGEIRGAADAKKSNNKKFALELVI